MGMSGAGSGLYALNKGDFNQTMGRVVKNHDHLFNNRTPPDVKVKDF